MYYHTHLERVLEISDLAVVPRHDARHFTALVPRRVLCTLIRKVEIALDAINLLLVARLETVEVVPCTIPFPNHISELEVLRLDVTLHALHLINGLLCRASLELEALGLVEQVEVLSSQVRVEFRESLVLVLP